MSAPFQNVLALDASTSRATVALCSNNLWYEEHIDATALQAQSLLPVIESLLSQAGLVPQQLDAISFGRGPGSFTGLRIACSIAKGLAYAHDLPLYPVSSLAVIAQQVFEKEGSAHPVLAGIDARMNQLYWAYYADMNDILAPEFVTDAQEITPINTPFIFAGVGLQSYERLISEDLLAQMCMCTEVYPSARTLISIVQTMRIDAVDVKDAAPVYVRNNVTHGEARG